MAELDLDALLQDDDDFGGLPAFAGNSPLLGRANEDNIDMMSSSMDQVSFLGLLLASLPTYGKCAEPNAVWLIQAATTHYAHFQR